jgi:uncharacterized phage infection (PIP) family protein YhgE
MKIRPTSIAALAAIPLVLAGCAAGPSQAAGPSPEGVAWTGKLCGLVSQFAAAEKQLPGLDRTNTDTLKKTMIERIDSTMRSADDTLRGLQGLGPSPIAGADQVNNDLQQGFTQLRDLLSVASDKAEQVDPTNRQRFQEGMAGVQQELQKGQQFDLKGALTQLEQNKELKAAAQRAPECKPFFTPPQQQPQPQPSR